MLTEFSSALEKAKKEEKKENLEKEKKLVYLIICNKEMPNTYLCANLNYFRYFI